MKKYLVINCDENDLDELRHRIGNRQFITCESIEDVSRYLPSPMVAAVVDAPNQDTAIATVADESNGGEANELDYLVKRVLEQQNGHAKTLAARVDLLEQKIIEYSLNRNGQHRKETAAELGISRVTLYNKMKKFGLLD